MYVCNWQQRFYHFTIEVIVHDKEPDKVLDAIADLVHSGGPGEL